MADAVRLVAVVGFVNVGLRLAVEFAGADDCRRLLVAEGRRGNVEDCSQILRREVSSQLAQHVDEDEGRAGGDAGLGRHGPLPRHGVIGAEDERHCVDQVDASLRSGRLGGHGDRRLDRASRFGSAGDGGGFRGFTSGGQEKILTSRGECYHWKLAIRASRCLLRDHYRRGFPRSIAGRENRWRSLFRPIQAHYHVDGAVGRGQPVRLLVR